MFKNESDVVMTKALKRYEMLSHKTQKSRSTKQTNTWVAAPDSGSESSVASPQETITLPLTSPIEDQALCFFFANYKMEPSSVLRGQFEFLGPLLNRGDTEPILQRSVHAASLASLANNTKSAFAMKRARQEYGAALAMTNRALESRETAVKDSTLICIMMLGLYETLMYEGKDSLLTCPKHVAGACTLLSLRGQDNFKTDTGRRVFQQFHRVVLLAAFQTDLVMPTAMERMWEEAESRGVYQIRARTWSTRMIRWLHDMARLKQNKTTDSATMVARATKLAHEFNEIRALIPEIFQYDTVYLERPAEYVFGEQSWVTNTTSETLANRTLAPRQIVPYLCRSLYRTVLEHFPKHAIGSPFYPPRPFTQRPRTEQSGLAEGTNATPAPGCRGSHTEHLCRDLCQRTPNYRPNCLPSSRSIHAFSDLNVAANISPNASPRPKSPRV